MNCESLAFNAKPRAEGQHNHGSMMIGDVVKKIVDRDDRTCTAISRVRIPTTARQSGSEVRLVVSTFITLIQYVYINRSSTDGRSTG